MVKTKRLSRYVLITVFSVLAIVLIGKNDNPIQRYLGADTSYAVTLNSENAPESLTESLSQDTWVGPKTISFSYINASSSSANLMTLTNSDGKNGVLKNNDQITSITGFSVAFTGSGSLYMVLGWSSGVWEDYYFTGDDLTSGQHVYVSNDYCYFSLIVVSGAVTIMSVTIEYSCVPGTPAGPEYILAPDGLSYIVTGATKNPVNLVIPATYQGLPVSGIAARSFNDNNVIESVVIGPNVIEIGTGAFMDCHNLVSVTLPDSLLFIGGAAFYNCWDLETIELPDSLSYIGEEAFYEAGLASISIPSSVTTIGEWAFYGADIETLTFGSPSNLTAINLRSFGNLLITSVTLPTGIITIGEYAFADNDLLETVIFPSTLTTIDHGAFMSCLSLNSIGGTLSNIDSIGAQAFYDTYWIDQQKLTSSIGVFDNRILIDGQDVTQANFTIPEGITIIGKEAFKDNNNIEEIVMPSTLLEVDDYAFYSSESLAVVDFDLSTNLLRIGIETFSYNYSLEIMTIPSSVIDIGDDAFYETDWFYNLKIPGQMLIFNDLIVADGSTLSGDVVVPNGITIILARAFIGADLDSIVLPGSLVRIGAKAFEYSIIPTITIPDSVTDIGKEALAWSEFISITVGSGVTIIPDLFACYNHDLEIVILPTNITSIGNRAFAACEVLDSFSLPPSLTYIGSSAFYACHSLPSQTIPNGVVAIEDNTFESCWAMTSVTLGEGIVSIGYQAFYECSALSSINLPSTLQSILSYAFQSCISLSQVILPISVERIEYYAFGGCAALSIFAEVASQPDAWNEYWNPLDRPVTWGYTGD